MANTEQRDVNWYRQHFGIKAPPEPKFELKPPEPKGKKKEVLPDGIIEPNGQTAKFKNKKIRIDGIVFDSLKEGDFYRSLKYQKESGFVSSYEIHKKYVFIMNGIRICSYTVDFVVHYPNGKTDVIDVKSFITRQKKDYQIRKKMMKAFFGIDVIEK